MFWDFSNPFFSFLSFFPVSMAMNQLDWGRPDDSRRFFITRRLPEFCSMSYGNISEGKRLPAD